MASIEVHPIVTRQVQENTGNTDSGYTSNHINFIKQYMEYVIRYPMHYYSSTGMYDEFLLNAVSVKKNSILIESDIHSGFYNGYEQYYFRVVIDGIRYHVYLPSLY